MFDMKKIMSLNADEILIANGLEAIAKEATEHSKLIHNTYRFGINEQEIELWHDSNNAEYLTYDGMWKARYLHESYDVKVDADSIFDYYRADWLVNNGYATLKDLEYCTKTQACKNFRRFVKRTQELFEKQNGI